jgi:biotin synthase
MTFSHEEIRALYDQPLLPLLDEARRVHLRHHPDNEVQLCTLFSVKTYGCPEDCAYCPQSSHDETSTAPEKMLDVSDVLTKARRAKELGSTRFCMGAAWREVNDGPAFDDWLRTLENVRRAGVTVCSGGIIGMGESIDDRCEMLRTLANLEPQPESVPINALVAVPGTPLAHAKPVDPLDLVRMIAVARILMPRARVRLSAGRASLSREAQMLCMLAGANSIFYGDKVLTTPNPEEAEDLALLRDAGLRPSVSAL